MDNKNLKQDLYLQKALISKGLDVNAVILMTSMEVEKLEISNKLKGFIYDIQQRAIPVTHTEDEIKNKVKELQKEPEVEVSASTAEAYVESDNSFKEEIAAEIVQAAEQEDKEIVERLSSNPDVVVMIKEALSSKALKTVPAYLKHIKQHIPEELLKEVDSTVISSMIQAHIEESKSSDK